MFITLLPLLIVVSGKTQRASTNLTREWVYHIFLKTKIGGKSYLFGRMYLWIMWITLWKGGPEWCHFLLKPIFYGFYPGLLFGKVIHSLLSPKKRNKLWIMWISYRPSRFSPTFTISPAPIVINKSPSEQNCHKKFSIWEKKVVVYPLTFWPKTHIT